jgi:hypothetical protein
VTASYQHLRIGASGGSNNIQVNGQDYKLLGSNSGTGYVGLIGNNRLYLSTII